MAVAGTIAALMIAQAMRVVNTSEETCIQFGHLVACWERVPVTAIQDTFEGEARR